MEELDKSPQDVADLVQPQIVAFLARNQKGKGKGQKGKGKGKGNKARVTAGS